MESESGYAGILQARKRDVAVNYLTLAKIDEIVRSIQHLATTLRAECPIPR